MSVIVASSSPTLSIMLLLKSTFVLQPFKTSSYPKTWLVLIILLFIWTLSSTVAVLPVTDVFHSYIPDLALLPDNPFVDQPVVSLEEGRTFLLQSLIYYPLPNHTKASILVEEINDAYTWNALAKIYNRLPEQKMQLRVAERFG